MERELRRARSRLRVLGSGMLLLLLWGLLKPALVILLGVEAVTEATQEPLLSALELEDPSVRTGVFVVLAVVLAVFVLLLAARLRVGLCARAVGRGERRGRGYIVIACIFFCLQTLLLVTTLRQIVAFGQLPENTVPETAASLLVEIGSVVTTGDLALTGMKVRRLEKRISEAG